MFIKIPLISFSEVSKINIENFVKLSARIDFIQDDSERF